MESLLRTRVAGFLLEDSLKLSDIERLKDEGGLEEHIASVDSVFKEYPSVTMKPEFDRLVHNGNTFYRDQTAAGCKYDGPVRVYDSSDRFIGIWESVSDSPADMEADREHGLMKPRKVFLGGN